MKRKYFLCLLVAALPCFSAIQAQGKQTTIINELEKAVPGEGVVQIDLDPGIAELIGPLSADSSEDSGNSIKTNGFRIQVFMSNNPRTAKDEIAGKESMIKNAFPEISTYKDYTPPNLKLSAGDFLTREEADVFKQKIQKALPSLGKEMYVVQDKVTIRMQKSN